MNTLVIAPNIFTMLSDHVKFVLNSVDLARHVAAIAILRNKLERDFLTTTANEQGNMRLLHTLWLVDCTLHLIIFALKDGFLLRPHRQDHLNRLAQLTQTFGRIGIGIAISLVLMLVPASTNPKIEPSMTKHINGAR